MRVKHLIQFEVMPGVCLLIRTIKETACSCFDGFVNPLDHVEYVEYHVCIFKY